MKAFRRILIVLLILALAACSVGNNEVTTSGVSVVSSAGTNGDLSPAAETSIRESATVTEAVAENSQVEIKTEDYVWDNATATAILLSGNSITVNGTGVAVEGSRAVIFLPGTYVISGSLSDGQIVVNTDRDEVVQLVLNDANITCSSSAPIDIISASDTAIILADNTENTLTDESWYVFDGETAEEPSATIFSNGNLSFSGNGSLTVNAAYNDGISSDDGIVIAGGTISVKAVDDGIRGKDYLVLENGMLNITAGGDGLKSDNAEDETKGYILVNAGSITVNAGGDGINAQTDLMISAGAFDITTAGGSSQASTASSKGIKGSVNVIIEDGTFTLNTADDGIHSNGSITINGGIFSISTADDGMHADESLTINGGSVQIVQSYEGLESSVITINGGDIRLVSSDDGINVAGGKDSTGTNVMAAGPGQGGGRPMPGGGSPGQDMFAFSGDYHLYINGGYITVLASGDGVDSNGTITMTDGTLLVNGPTANNNGALDHAGFAMTGGYLVAAGSSGMAQAPDQTSGQYSVLIYFTSTLPAGTLVHIENSAGDDILTFAPTKQFSSIAFSSTSLVNGETYKIYTGGSTTGTMVDSLVQGGTYSGGTAYTSFTVSGIVTNVGSGGRNTRQP